MTSEKKTSPRTVSKNQSLSKGDDKTSSRSPSTSSVPSLHIFPYNSTKLNILVKSGKIKEDSGSFYLALKFNNSEQKTSVKKSTEPVWGEEFVFDVPSENLYEKHFAVELWNDSLIGSAIVPEIYTFRNNRHRVMLNMLDKQKNGKGNCGCRRVLGCGRRCTNTNT